MQYCRWSINIESAYGTQKEPSFSFPTLYSVETKNESLSIALEEERSWRRRTERRNKELEAKLENAHKRAQYLQEEISKPSLWVNAQTSEDFARELGPGAASTISSSSSSSSLSECVKGTRKVAKKHAGTFKAPLAKDVTDKPRFR